MNARTVAGSISILAVLTACSNGGHLTDTAVRRDSAGITIVENSAPSWGEGSAWRVDTAPMLAIASDAGEGAEFQSIMSVVRLENGTTVATDTRPPFVRAFDTTGSLAWTAVREGGGPGELRTAGPLSRLRGDSLILDAFAPENRAVLLTADGEFAGDRPGFTPPAMENEPGTMRMPGIMLRLTNGDAVAFLSRLRPGDLDLPGIRTADAAFYLLSRGNPPRLIDRWPTMLMGGGTFAILLGSRIALAPMPDGFVHGWSTRDEFGVYDNEGDLTMLVRGPASPRAPTSAEIQAVRDAFLEQRGDSPATQQQLASAGIADSVALYNRIVTSTDGHVWRERFDASAHDGPWAPRHPAVWDIFAPDGTLRGAVETPAHFRLLSAGNDWVAGVHVDEMDVQTPRVYPLLKP